MTEIIKEQKLINRIIKILEKENPFPRYLKAQSRWYGDGSNEASWDFRNKEIANKIVDEINKSGVKIKPKTGQFIFKLYIKTEFREYLYEVESGQVFNFVDINGEKLKLIPMIEYKESEK